MPCECSCKKNKQLPFLAMMLGIGGLFVAESKAETIVYGSPDFAEPVHVVAYPEARARGGVKVINNINTGAAQYQAPVARTGRGAMYQGFDGCIPGEPCDLPPPVVAQPVVYAPPPPPPAPVVRAVPKPKVVDNSPRQVLADPFFQPLQGHIGSVTDVGYYTEQFGFNIIDCTGPWGGLDGSWKTSGLTIKEDLSVGVLDNLALIGSLKYSNYKYVMGWEGLFPEDNAKKSGVEVWGLGAQWKFYEDQDWVMFLGGYYQSYWGDTTGLLLDSKIGYKFDSMTVYGLFRLLSLNFSEPNYGYGITNQDTGQTAFIVLGYDTKSALFVEGGLGLFTLLDPDWSLNLEFVYGSYEWHNNASGKAAIYWQPGRHFALGVYAKTTLFDSPKTGDNPFAIYSWDAGDTIATHMGNVDINNYRETQFGVQGILYF